MSVDSKSSSWASIFDELTAAESSLDACFTIFEEAVNENKPSSADFKSENWRQLHASLSRNGKQLDKEFPGYEFEELSCDSSSNIMQKHWRDAIGEVLLREGFNLDESFSASTLSLRSAYQHLSTLLKHFSTDINYVFDWIKSEFPPGEIKESLIVEFLQFLFFQRLRKEDFTGALKLIRQNSREITIPRHQKVVSKLLTSCLFARNGSGLNDILKEPSLDKIKTLLVQSYCQIAQIPKSDPIAICNEIGTKAIPMLVRVNNLLKNKSVTALSANDELPIEIPLEADQRYHSLFACPVTKQQATTASPPFLLPCGHALSKEAVTRLSKGNNLV